MGKNGRSARTGGPGSDAAHASEVLRATWTADGPVYVCVQGTGAIRFAGGPEDAAAFMRARGAVVPEWLEQARRADTGAP